MDLIIIPINIANAHWAIIVLDLKKKRIVRYDSLSVSRACERTTACFLARALSASARNHLSTRYPPLASQWADSGLMDAVLSWLMDYAKFQCDTDIDTSEWTREARPSNTPQQRGKLACGIFSCM